MMPCDVGPPEEIAVPGVPRHIPVGVRQDVLSGRIPPRADNQEVAAGQQLGVVPVFPVGIAPRPDHFPREIDQLRPRQPLHRVKGMARLAPRPVQSHHAARRRILLLAHEPGIRKRLQPRDRVRVVPWRGSRRGRTSFRACRWRLVAAARRSERGDQHDEQGSAVDHESSHARMPESNRGDWPLDYGTAFEAARPS